MHSSSASWSSRTQKPGIVIIKQVEQAGADGIELNFGCPHGMSERGMGSCFGQVPEYTCDITTWAKASATTPVFVKLTPNITDIRAAARAAKNGGADAVSLINTINSITGVDLDSFTPRPVVGDMSSHGGYCGPAVKPIALNMVASIAADPFTEGLPISGIGGIQTWQDVAEYILLGATTIQVCTAVMHYGYRIVEGMAKGFRTTLDSKGHGERQRTSRVVRGSRHRLAEPRHQLRRQGKHRPGGVHRVRHLLHRLPGRCPSGHRCEALRRGANRMCGSLKMRVWGATCAALCARCRGASPWKSGTTAKPT